MTSEQSEFYGRFWEIWNDLAKLIPEFETTLENPDIKEALPTAQHVYMHEIIISLWMILGDGQTDKFTLSRVSELFPNAELRNKAGYLLKEHKVLIGKLKKNRNWISAHRDSRLVDLGYSDEYVKGLEDRFDVEFPLLRSKNRTDERYTPNDMSRDLPEIKQILTGLEEIWRLIPGCVA